MQYLSKRNMVYLTITLIYLILSSCSKKQAEPMEPAKPEEPATKVTYNNFVQGLFQSKCAMCHAPGNSAAAIWTFNGYSTVTGNSANIRRAVITNKTMPKTGSLSASELQSLSSWFDNGMPEQ